jgi:hypothetical protein
MGRSVADPLASEVIKDWERYDGERGTWKSHCQKVALYLDPDRADFTTENSPGQKRMQYVFDASPLFAHEVGAVGLHSSLTSDTMPWFSTVPDNERLAADGDVRAWFAAADAADYAVFNNPERNFATQSHQVYLDLLGYGGAAMGLLDGRTGALFTNRHLAECCFAENEEDRVDQLSRRWQWTAKQAVDQWQGAAGDKANKAVADGKDNEKFWFHHRVKPRAQAKRDPLRADGKHKPFESVYVAEADQIVISEGGFDGFPYLCPRLSKRTVQDVMGRGRGFMMLPDIKMLNSLAREVIFGVEIANRPPMQLPDDGYIVPIKQVPGSLNYYRAGLRPTDRIGPILTGANPPIGLDFMTRLETKIERGFFNNLLVTPADPDDPASAGKGVTATFTARQQQQETRQLSAINARLNAEWTAPLVERMRAMNWRKSVAMRFGPGSPYPPPPPQLSGMRWHSEFKSPIALAQRAAEMTAIDQLWQRQLLMRQIDPEGPLILDSEATLRLEARDLNAPPEILKSPRVLQAEAALKAQMAQQQHQAQIAEQGTGAVANLAGAQAQMQRAA